MLKMSRSAITFALLGIKKSYERSNSGRRGRGTSKETLIAGQLFETRMSTKLNDGER